VGFSLRIEGNHGKESALVCIVHHISVGARPFQVLLWAIWPRARPLLISYTVLRWEVNLRASTILGLVGRWRPGAGDLQQRATRFLFSPEYSDAVDLWLVLTSDWLGERVRWRVA
jgi:phosphonate transport system permease protein